MSLQKYIRIQRCFRVAFALLSRCSNVALALLWLCFSSALALLRLALLYITILGLSCVGAACSVVSALTVDFALACLASALLNVTLALLQDGPQMAPDINMAKY